MQSTIDAKWYTTNFQVKTSSVSPGSYTHTLSEKSFSNQFIGTNIRHLHFSKGSEAIQIVLMTANSTSIKEWGWRRNPILAMVLSIIVCPQKLLLPMKAMRDDCTQNFHALKLCLGRVMWRDQAERFDLVLYFEFQHFRNNFRWKILQQPIRNEFVKI